MALKLKGSTSGFENRCTIQLEIILILPENTGAQQLLGNDITASVTTYKCNCY